MGFGSDWIRFGGMDQAEERLETGRWGRSHWAATAASSKGRRRQSRIWNDCRPRPAIRTASPGSGSGQGLLDRGATIGPDPDPTRLAEPGQEVVEDLVGVLGPRVVGGQDDEVGDPISAARPSSSRSGRSRCPSAPRTQRSRPAPESRDADRARRSSASGPA